MFRYHLVMTYAAGGVDWLKDDMGLDVLLSLDSEIFPMDRILPNWRKNKHAQGCEGWNYFP